MRRMAYTFVIITEYAGVVMLVTGGYLLAGATWGGWPLAAAGLGFGAICTAWVCAAVRDLWRGDAQ